jgi:4-hydroxy-4-methyl-2-oxoglutarate aldolase
LECAPGDNLAIHIAVERVPRGSVLVIKTSNFLAGYWGEVLTVAAEVAGVAGLIIDGGVRDITALEAHQFPVFARGISARGTGKSSALSVGRPITFTDVPVSMGDLVVGDMDGVIIIPAAAVEKTIKSSEERATKEGLMMEKLREGVSTLELLSLTKWRNHA